MGRGSEEQCNNTALFGEVAQPSAVCQGVVMGHVIIMAMVRMI
jgi:hypothetical protein